MAKGNQKTRDLKLVENHFDQTMKLLDEMAESVRLLMPLASESLQLTKNIVKEYKAAFNAGLKYVPKK